MRPNRSEMISMLQKGKCEVFFEKKNGEIRHMFCTLDPNIAPEINLIKNKSTTSQKVVAAWDMEQLAWRSFRVTSVLTFKEHPDDNK